MSYDLNYGSVSLHLHAEGANASTTFADSSPSPKTLTATGNAQISTTQKKFGNSSMKFDGAGDYLTAPHNTDFSIQGGDFTLEAWVYRAASGVSHYLLSKRNAVTTNGWEWRVNADNTLQFFHTGGSSLLSSGTVPSGQWVHLATVRSGSTLAHYIDGTASGSGACTNGTENTTDTLKVGADSTLTSEMNGYIDELRITKGVARYTADFTPATDPFQSGPDASFANVSLLMHADGANASTTFTDSSSSPKTITATGNAQISTAQSKFGGASAKFDGSGDYLSAANNTAFEFGTGDFTVEGWIYIDATSSTDSSGNRNAAIATYGTTNGSNTSYWWFYVIGNTTTTGIGLEFNSQIGATAYTVSANVTVTQSAWHHVAVSRVSGSTKLFLDGTELTLGTNTLTTQAVTGLAGQPLTIGAALATGYTQPLNGYIDELRITKGVARYTDTFTPPGAEFPTQVVNAGTATLSVTAPIPNLTAYFGGSASVTAPMALVYVGPIGSITADITAPVPTISSYCGGWASLEAPTPTLVFTAHNSYGENALFVTAPTPTLAAYCGGYATLTAPTPTLTSSATGTALLSATLTGPTPTLAASGTVSAVARIEVTAPMARLIGYGGAVCSVTGPAGTLTASGTTGGVARVTATVPMARLTASVTANGYASAILTAPAGRMAGSLQAYLIAPGATLTAIGSATITATYEAYALNLNHAPRQQRGVQGENDAAVDELTRYTNFPFTHVVRYKNSYYGVAAGALYLLEGTTDDGDPIPYAVQTAKTDFDMTERKTVVSAYLGGRLGAAETISLVVGEHDTKVYSHTTPRGPLAQNYRQKFGLGIRDRYYALRVEGSDVFELDTIDFEVNKLTRRI